MNYFCERILQFAVYSLQSAHGYYTAAKGSHRLPHQLHAEERLLALLRGDRARTGPHLAGNRSQTCDQPAEQGLLQRAHNRSRSIEVLPPRSSKKGFDRLPLVGRIAAGKPIEAVEMAETISLGDIIGNREVFALEVAATPCATSTSSAATTCWWSAPRRARGRDHRRPGGRLRRDAEALLPRGRHDPPATSNKEMAPIFAPAANVAIQGKVLGILRKYA